MARFTNYINAYVPSISYLRLFLERRESELYSLNELCRLIRLLHRVAVLLKRMDKALLVQEWPMAAQSIYEVQQALVDEKDTEGLGLADAFRQYTQKAQEHVIRQASDQLQQGLITKVRLFRYLVVCMLFLIFFLSFVPSVV